jgi:hypothetical protein
MNIDLRAIGPEELPAGLGNYVAAAMAAATMLWVVTPGGGAWSAGTRRPRPLVPLTFAPGEAYQFD